MEVEYDGLVRDLLRAKAYHSDALKAATLVMAEFFVRFIDDYMAGHHDTNRYINGWIFALHAIGITSVRKKVYNKSSRYEQYVQKLTEQRDRAVRALEREEDILERYRLHDALAPPRKDGQPRKKRLEQPHAIRKIERVEWLRKQVKRTERELRRALGSETIIFFDRFANERRTRENHTVRHKLYGGTGKLYTVGEQLIVELDNKEPHARLVEKHPKIGHPMKAAFAALKHVGLRRASKAYINRQAERFGPPTPTDVISVIRENETRHALAAA